MPCKVVVDCHMVAPSMVRANANDVDVHQLLGFVAAALAAVMWYSMILSICHMQISCQQDGIADGGVLRFGEEKYQSWMLLLLVIRHRWSRSASLQPP